MVAFAAGPSASSMPDPLGEHPPKVASLPMELSLPAAMVRLMEQAMDAAPRALALERELALAASRHRASVGVLETSTGLRANVEGRHDSDSGDKGVGAAVQWTVRKPMGRSELVLSVGPGIAQKWRSSKVEAAPVVGLTVSHPFGQGPDVRRERADHEFLVAVQRYERGLNELLRDVVRAYGRVETAAAAREAAWIRLRLETLKLEEARLRTHHGDGTAIALHEAQRRYADALDEWEGAQLALEDAKRTLALLVGADFDESQDSPKNVPEADHAYPQGASLLETTLRLALPEGVRAPRTLDEWIRLAQSERVERSLAVEAVTLAEAELESARRKRGWTGELSARAVYPDPDSFPGDAVRRVTWRAGVQLSLPLSDPAGSEAVTQAELKLEEARAALDLLDRQIEAEVTAAFYQADQAVRRYERARRYLEQAGWLLEVATDNVDAGLEPEQALWEARLAHALAHRDATEARFAFIQQVLALWQATGRDATW